MIKLSQHQRHALQDLFRSAREIEYGRSWPEEYTNFFRLWGFFNRFYEVLYANAGEEWKRIAHFSLDNRFSDAWDALEHDVIRHLAQQPCVGNGRDRYEPSDHVRIAFETLRRGFRIDVQEVCQHEKCQLRSGRGWQLCSELEWDNWPQVISKPEYAKYSPMGATLTILYQIRNNLFHGSKLEIQDPQFERNRLLVGISARITEQLLQYIAERVEALLVKA